MKWAYPLRVVLPGVTEPARDHSKRHPSGEHRGGREVAQIMKADLVQTGPATEAFPAVGDQIPQSSARLVIRRWCSRTMDMVSGSRLTR